MNQQSDKLEVIDVREPQRPAPEPAPGGAAKKAPRAAGSGDSGAPVPDTDLSAKAQAAIFAHEVVNSLTAINCSLQFVKTELDAHRIDDPYLTKVVHSALAEIHGVGTLVHEYCALARAKPPEWQLTDVATLVDEVLALQTVVCRVAGIIVHFECEEALPRMRLDALKIKQVITNLCKNAYEAMPRGGQLILRVFRAGQAVVLEVSDSGIGIPHGINVFELFKTTKAGGCGVGLALAQEIISAHHGTIAFSSEPDRGTTFKISLPIDDAARAPNAR